MPVVFEQPNLDALEISHLYFDTGEGRLITIFAREERVVDKTPNPNDAGNLHHLAFNVSLATCTQVRKKLKQFGIANSGEIDRGFMHLIYFRDPLGQLLELACYKSQAPRGVSESDVLHAAHKIRVAAGDISIDDKHIAEALGKIGRQ